MHRISFAAFIGMCMSFLIAASSLANEGSSDRWYGAYLKGDKVGNSHATFKEFQKDGSQFRESKSKGYILVRGKMSYDYGYDFAKGSVNYEFRINSSHNALFQDGKVISLKAKRKLSKGMDMNASSTLDGDTLVLRRKEGILGETLRIAPGDYDLTSDPSELEPFLKTVTETPVKVNYFSLNEAKVEEVTFVRRKDGTTKDIDGKEKACKVYRLTSEESKVILKTINDVIVYARYQENGSTIKIVYRQTTKKRAKSETGY